MESVVDAIWFNQGQVCSAGSKLLVQQPVFEKFIGKLKTRLSHFRIGDTLDKAIDMAAIVDESQRKSVAEFVDEARAEGAEIFQTDCPPGCFYPPTLVTNVNTCSKIVMEEVFGPVLVAMPLRTAKEVLAWNLAIPGTVGNTPRWNPSRNLPTPGTPCAVDRDGNKVPEKMSALCVESKK